MRIVLINPSMGAYYQHSKVAAEWWCQSLGSGLSPRRGAQPGPRFHLKP